MIQDLLQLERVHLHVVAGNLLEEGLGRLLRLAATFRLLRLVGQLGLHNEILRDEKLYRKENV